MAPASDGWRIFFAAMGGGGATAVFGGLLKLLGWWSARQDRLHRTSIDELWAIIRRLELYNEEMRLAHGRCRRTEVQLRQHLVYLHGAVAHRDERLAEKGVVVEKLRPLCEFIPEDGEAEAQEKDKQLQQNRILLSAAIDRAAPRSVKPPSNASPSA